MTASVKARCANGVLTPLELLHLEEGKEVVVSIEDAPPRANGKESILEMFERLSESVPPDPWENLPLPTDLFENKKHYLYGHPREAE